MNKSTYINITTILVKSLYIALVLLLLGLIIYTQYFGYEKIVFLILERYDKLNRISEFKNQYFTYDRFISIQIALSVFLVGLLLFIRTAFKVAPKAYLLINHTCGYFQKVFNAIKNGLSELTTKEKITFVASLFLITVLKFYFLLKFPFHIDEISSYMYFIDKGFFVSMSYYPNPNNHIFYSVICCFLKPFFSDPFYLVRVPSIVISVFASLTVFIFVKRYFGFPTAFFTYVLFSLTPFLFYYSFHGRGYMLMTFFVIISTYSMMKIVENSRNHFYWLTYVLASIFGFYTMVIYLYPFAALTLYFIIVHSKSIKRQEWQLFIGYYLLVSTAVIILYLPVFLVSGISSITSNSWVIRMSFDQYLSYLPVLLTKEFSYLTGLDGYSFFLGPVILLLAFAILAMRKEYNWLIMLVCAFIVPLIIILVQRVQIYERIWTYLTFYQAIAAGIIFYYTINRTIRNNTIQYASSLLFSCCLMLFTTLTYQRAIASHGVYDDVKPIVEYIYNKKAKNICVTENTYSLYIRYKYTIEKKAINIDSSPIGLEDTYDFIIIDKKNHLEAPINQGKFLKVYSNEYADVYELKK